MQQVSQHVHSSSNQWHVTPSVGTMKPDDCIGSDTDGDTDSDSDTDCSYLREYKSSAGLLYSLLELLSTYFDVSAELSTSKTFNAPVSLPTCDSGFRCNRSKIATRSQHARASIQEKSNRKLPRCVSRRISALFHASHSCNCRCSDYVCAIACRKSRLVISRNVKFANEQIAFPTNALRVYARRIKEYEGIQSGRFRSWRMTSSFFGEESESQAQAGKRG